MGTIDSSIAQNIVNYMMKIVPYSINIIDNTGIIIASGDRSRIGQSHEIALKAIKSNSVQIVHSNSKGMKKGVNMPFHFRGKVAGVVGISGDTEKGIEIIKLVKCSIELLIEQEALINTKLVAQQLKSQFLMEWIYLSPDYSTDFIARGKGLDINVNKPRRVAIVQLPPDHDNPDIIEKNPVNRNFFDYYIRISATNYILIFSKLNSLLPQLNSFIEANPDTLVGFGEKESIINNSLLQAHSALRLGHIICPDGNIFLYSDIKHFDAMLYGLSASKSDNRHFNTLHELVNEENQYLLTTMLSYFNNNGEMNVVANELHIHRNTLRYRLEKIHEITSLDPCNYKDLIALMCAYIQFKLSPPRPIEIEA